MDPLLFHTLLGARQYDKITFTTLETVQILRQWRKWFPGVLQAAINNNEMTERRVAQLISMNNEYVAKVNSLLW